MAESLLKALAAFQLEMTSVSKDGKANYGKYVTLPKIIEEVQPVLNRHGLLIIQCPSTSIDGQAALTTTIAHPESGEQFDWTSPLSLAKVDPQSQGSAITYMRRYMYAAVTQIVVDEDDDGQRASTPSAPKAASPKQVDFAESLLRNADKDKAREWYKAKFGNKPTSALTSKECSDFIEYLQNKPSDVAQYSDEPFDEPELF